MGFSVSYSIEFFEDEDFYLIDEKISDFDTDIYHNSSWVEANKYLENGSLFSILVENGDNKAYLPLLKRKIDNTDYFDLITPYGYGGIAFSWFATNHFKQNVLSKIHSYLEKTNCISLFLRLHPILNSDLHDDVYIHKNGMTLAVNLENSFESISKNYSSGHRYDIRKSLKNESITVVDDVSFEYFERFIEVYTETMHLLDASDFYFFDREYFHNLKENLDNSLKLIVVKLNNSVIGASLFMLHNNIIQYHLSGTISEGRGYQPSKLILNYMIQWGVENNYKYLHLGGGVGSEKDHLYEFKKRFSATEFEFCTVRMITNKDMYTDLCKILKYSEDEIHNTSDFFPLYRK